MGGLETEVTAATKNILLESANFDFVSIRRTAHKFTLFSEASTRFSRGVHPEVVVPAALHAAQLMADHAGGQVARGMIDQYPAPLPPQVTTLQRREIRRLLGIEFTDAEVERVLTALQFMVQKTADGWQVTTPPTRLDIQAGAADLIEELARIHGYDRLTATLLSGELPAQRNNRELVLENAARDTLANLGLREAICRSLTNPATEAHLGGAADHVELVNPISPELAVMRRHLLTNLLGVVQENLKHTPTVRVFELGAVFHPNASARLPDEPRRLAIVLTGHRNAEAWDDDLANRKPALLDFYDLKGVVEALFAALHVDVTFQATRAVPFLHPGRTAECVVKGQPVGVFGELHPKTANAFDLAERTLFVADLDWQALLALIPERFAYTVVPEHQAAKRDIAVVVDQHTTNEAVVKEIRAAGGELLAAVQLFDVYTGDSIAAGKKSLAYALTYQANRVLKDAEIDKAHEKIESRLKHVLKASIRGKE
jgi:phenylalanyl-tRNA synthetase beta chain